MASAHCVGDYEQSTLSRRYSEVNLDALSGGTQHELRDLGEYLDHLPDADEEADGDRHYQCTDC